MNTLGARNMRGIVLLISLLSILVFSGCAGTMQAIEHREMSLSARMSDTIFLDPDAVSTHRNIFVRVTNTSDFQEIDFAEILKSKLAAKGFTITNVTNGAYIVQANLLYMGQQKQGLTADGMLAGGYGGAILGSGLGSGNRANLLGAGAGGVAGAVLGGVLGSVIHVDTYMGAVDIQIKEPAGSEVRAHTRTDAQQGSSTMVTTESSKVSDKQEYRTRIVVQAKQTNINRQVACGSIADRLAQQIAGMF